MPHRLEIARLQLRQLKVDRLFNDSTADTELVAIAKINEALALLREAQVIFAEVEEKKFLDSIPTLGLSKETLSKDT